MVEGWCCLSTRLFCMRFRKNNRYEVQGMLYRLERSGQVWKSEKMSIWLKGKIMGQKWWEIRLDRQLYSDYIESQAKEFQHHFEWLEAIKYLGTIEGHYTEFSSQKNNLEATKSNDWKRKKIMCYAILKTEIDLKEHGSYNWQGLMLLLLSHISRVRLCAIP